MFHAKRKRKKGYLLAHVTNKSRQVQVQLDPELKHYHENAVSLYFSVILCAASAAFSDWLSSEGYMKDSSLPV